MKKYLLLFVLATIALLSVNVKSFAQAPGCNPDVPFFNIDLTNHPDSVWESPSVSRSGDCPCVLTAPNSAEFISLTVIMDPNTAMLEYGLLDGASPSGHSYQLGCTGTPIPASESVCVAGPGTQYIYYYKPGSNKNRYYLRSIPKPTFPDDITTRIGCSAQIKVMGLSSLTIHSLGPINYDAYINSTTINTFTGTTIFNFTPGLDAPDFIDYQICGKPIAASCGYVDVCETVRVNIKELLELNVNPNPATFCTGSGGVTLTASALGGTGLYTYTWFNQSGVQIGTGTTFNAPAVTSFTNYTVEVKDGLESSTCPSERLTVPVTPGFPPTVYAGADQELCNTTVSAILTASYTNASGGIWTGGLGTFTTTNPSSYSQGIYDPNAIYTPTAGEKLLGTVTLSFTTTGMGGGCNAASDVVNLVWYPDISVTIPNPGLNCYGDKINLTPIVSGGKGTYKYYWGTGAITPTINVGAGTYCVTVVDELGCGKNVCVTITNPPALAVNMSTTDCTLDGASDGTATVAATGGTGAYSYLWNNGQTTITATGLSYGLYNVTVTDAKGCKIIGYVVVNEPRCNGFVVSAINSSVSCFGGSNASATSSIVGGTSPFTYTWNTSPTQNTAIATGLSAGGYTITVNDNNGCVDVASVIVTEPTRLANTMTHTDNSTIGGTVGTATANVTGGTPGYNYLWTPGAKTTSSITGLAAGTYYLNVNDLNSCPLSDSVKINEPPCNNFIVVVNKSDVRCSGANDGSASVVIAHGNPPYTVSWSNGFSGTSVKDLAPGTYTVTVTDAKECTTFQSFIISQPSALSLALVPTHMSCFGVADGTIDLSVTGGNYPYSYAWLKGGNSYENTEDLINLSNETYSVTITDAKGCKKTSSVGITQPSKIMVTATVNDVKCNGDSNGSVSASVSGGTPTYTYAWSNTSGPISVASSISNLAAGSYYLTVTDNNSCSTLKEEFYVNQPSLLKVNSILTNCPAPGASTALVNVNDITGGTGGPYQVSFNNGSTYTTSGIYTATLTLNSTYTVLAKDANNCTSSANPYTLVINPTVAVSATFNPCIPTNATSITVTAIPTGGSASSYTVSFDNGITFETLGVFTKSIATGLSYNIVAKDGLGCVSLPFTISIPNELKATATEQNKVSCLGQSDGSISLTVTGGKTPYTYAWSGPSTFASTNQNITGLVAGNYSVTITDAYSCSKVSTVSLTTFPDVTLPTISCPANITKNTDLGVCGAIVTYTAPIGNDNCPGAVTNRTSGLASGSVFPTGVSTVTYSVTDLAGNSASCSFTITVTDNEAPVFTACPSNISLNTNAGLCTAVATWTTPTFTDNCGASLTSSHVSGAAFATGTTVVTYTATDVKGNTKLCTFTVTVTDNEAPVFTSCPSNISKNTDLGLCTAVATWTTPTFTDNCGASLTSSHASGFAFSTGTTVVTYTATDVKGNSKLCTFTVTVTDNEAPVISGCPANISRNTDAGQCNAIVAWTPPTATDNCSTTLTASHAPGSVFTTGTTIVTYTAKDVKGNTTLCTFTVTVTDNEAPVFTSCPSNISKNTDLGLCTAVVTWTAPSATDNCSFTVTSSHTSGAVFNTGTTVVTYTATDVKGNTKLCTFTVTVTDNEAPVFTACPSNISLSTNAGLCTAVATWTTPTFTDNCGASLTSSHASGFAFSTGTTVVTYTATDVKGNTKLCTFTVTVIDNEAPVFTVCPANITKNTDAGLCTAVATWTTPTFTDNCGASLTSSHASGFAFSTGTTVVTYTATDVKGNSKLCTFTVTVTDNEAPVISGCPANISRNTDAGQCNAVVAWTPPTATDNCSTTLTASHAPGSVFTTGTTIVTYTAKDVKGNTTLCTFTVTVTDNEAPVFTSCPSNISKNTDLGLCTAVVTWTAPSATDNCSFTVTSSHTSGAVFTTGTTIVTYTATDVKGNTKLCTFTVTVTDNEAPVFTTCPSNINTNPDLGVCTALVTWTAPSFTDNCGATLTSSHVSGGTFATGTTLVTYTATDVKGNITLCTFTVTVTDNEAPVFTSCPNNISINTDLGNCTAIVTWTAPTVTDNCGFILTQSHNSSDLFNIGTSIVTYTATDNIGNTSICTFSVIVTDNEKPTVTSCQTNISSCVPVVSFTAPTATDNCGIATISLTTGLASGTSFPLGTTTQEFTITDVNGNTSICSFTITINPVPELTYTFTDVTCKGFNDGTIDLVVSSGTSPFTYTWSGANSYSSSNEDISGLQPGTYNVNLVDINTCSATTNVTIAEPQQLQALQSFANVKCFNGNDGSIDITPFGGVGSYTFVWSNSSTNEDITGLTIGTYSVTVNDANSCEITLPFELTQPTSMTASATTIAAQCESNTGKIDLTVLGGTLPYGFVWSNTEITEDLTNTAAGTYTVVVTDFNNCVSTFTQVLEKTQQLTADATQFNIKCFGGNEGYIDLSVTTGESPFAFNWSNGLTTEDISGLTAGTYTVTITDKYKCELKNNYIINQPDSLVLAIESPLQYSGHHVSLFGGNDGSIELTATGGTLPYAYNWSNGMNTEDIQGLTSNQYSVVVTDENNCVAKASIYLSQPMSLEMPDAFSPNDDTKNDEFIVHGLEAYPDNEIMIFNRWGNLIYSVKGYQNNWRGENNNGDVLPDGTYFVILKINNPEIILKHYVDMRRK